MTQEHFHNTIVSRLFLVAAIVMLVTYPFFSSFLPESPFFIIILIALLSIMAALTNPRGRLVASVDILISLFSFTFFQSHAIVFVKTSLIWLFITDEILALIFLAALYFSVRTLRKTFSN